MRVGDVLSRIPAKFLKKGPHDVRGEMRFNVREIFEKITRGRASLPLSKIAKLCPQLFRVEVGPIDDVEIPLPLQKLVEQIGLFASAAHAHHNHAFAPPSANNELPAANGTKELSADMQQTVIKQPTTLAPSAEPQDPNAFANHPNPATAINGAEQKEKPTEMISLALTPIFRLLPGSVARHAPAPDPAARIALPMELIEPQLLGGHVEISLDDFLKALPENLRIYMIRVADVRVWIPLDEIFQNLPAHHQYHMGTATVLVENETAADETNPVIAEPADFTKSSEPEIIFALSALQGVFASIAISKNGTLASPGPGFPSEIKRSSLEAALGILQNLARDHSSSLRWTRTVTLHCEDFFLTAAIRGESAVCILHREQVLNATTPDRLAQAADEFEHRWLRVANESAPSLPFIEKQTDDRR